MTPADMPFPTEDDDAPSMSIVEAVNDALVVRLDRERRARIRGEVLMTAALLPFGFTGLVNPTAWIGYVVLILGVLCHGGLALEWRCARTVLCKLDTLCNVVLCGYVNYATRWQPGTALLTAVAASCWVVNSHVSDNPSPLVHVVLVQWLLCSLLYVFEAGQ